MWLYSVPCPSHQSQRVLTRASASYPCRVSCAALKHLPVFSKVVKGLGGLVPSFPSSNPSRESLISFTDSIMSFQRYICAPNPSKQYLNPKVHLFYFSKSASLFFLKKRKKKVLLFSFPHGTTLFKVRNFHLQAKSICWCSALAQHLPCQSVNFENCTSPSRSLRDTQHFISFPLCFSVSFSLVFDFALSNTLTF